jgi:hypothetical protein
MLKIFIAKYLVKDFSKNILSYYKYEYEIINILEYLYLKSFES